MKKKWIVSMNYEIPENATMQQRWILNIMNECKLNITKLSDIMHTSRQHIYDLLYNRYKIKFVDICAIIYLLKLNEDPENIWNLINRNWNNGVNEEV